MSGFREYEPQQLEVPIRGAFGQAVATHTGAARDEEIALLRVALLCRLPAKCPDDALDAVGRAFAIERYPGESHDSYRARLVAAWPTWEEAGACTSIEGQIRAAFGCDVRVWPIDELDFGPDPRANYSEFSIVIGPELGTFAHDAAQVRMLKRIALRWKAAHGYAVEIIIIDTDGWLLGYGDTTLGDGTALGSGSITRYRIGRTLNGTWGTLGDASTCILGGYDLT